MRVKPLVLIFVRQPLLGAVKTRLAAGIGPAAARRFYIETTGRVIRRIEADPHWETRLAYTPDTAAALDRIWPNAPGGFGQGMGDLGQRMERALCRFADRKIVLVGSDIPDLSAAHIGRAFDHLGRHDFVFGPATDGGYWLVGVKAGALAAGLFKDVRWSGPHALADTLANTRGRPYALCDTLADIDTADDLHLLLQARQ